MYICHKKVQMECSRTQICITFFLLFNGFVFAQGKSDSSFEETYEVTWGNDHILQLSKGSAVQLSIDKYSGSGFASKLKYGSGFFNLRIKLPDNVYTAGLVVAFFLTSTGSNHDEIDFEFLGHTKGKPYVLQTNVFANGQGNREQRHSLWFDPSSDFHSYQILWNSHQIVLYIDDVPIRVFKNNTSIGVAYPTQPMQIQVSLWNGDAWATDLGRAKMDYSYGPFKAQFTGFGINGCSAQDSSSTIHDCYSSQYWWNKPAYWELDRTKRSVFEKAKKYVYYDYCNDKGRFPNGAPPECSSKGSTDS